MFRGIVVHMMKEHEEDVRQCRAVRGKTVSSGNEELTTLAPHTTKIKVLSSGARGEATPISTTRCTACALVTSRSQCVGRRALSAGMSVCDFYDSARCELLAGNVEFSVGLHVETTMTDHPWQGMSLVQDAALYFKSGDGTSVVLEISLTFRKFRSSGGPHHGALPAFRFRVW